MAFLRTTIAPEHKPLTPAQKLFLEINASTRKPDHEKQYAEIADSAAEKHEQRLAKQGRVSELEQAANAVMEFDIRLRRK